jgi:hypothetical protein
MTRQTIAHLGRVEPLWGVLPASKSLDDIQIARLGEDSLHHYWQFLQVHKKYLQTLFWTCTTGTGILKTGWDPNAGAPVNVDLTGDTFDQFFTTLIGKPVPKTLRKNRINVGEPYVSIVSPFSILYQFGKENIQDSIYVIETEVVDVYEAEKQYHKVIKSTSQPRAGLNYLEGVQALMGTKKSPPNIGELPKDKAVKYTMYVKPHGGLRNGLKRTMIEGEDMHKPQDFPYNHGKLPYAIFPEVPIPGRFMGTSTLHQNRGNQMVVNRLYSQMIEYANLMLKGKWLIQKGTSTDYITDAPGQNIRFGGNIPPQQARLQPLPKSLMEVIQIFRQNMQDTASSHDILSGRIAPSVRSGNLAETLKESDLTVLGPTQLLHDIAMAELGGMLLQNLAQYVKEQRLISITRGGRLAATRKFIGADLVGNTPTYGANYFNVITTATGRAPWSQFAQREKIRVLAEAGFLRPGEHDQIVMKAIGLENSDYIFERADLARNKQYEESKYLNEGKEITPNRQDLHEVHLEIMDLENEDFEFVQNLSPEAIQVREKHYAAHERLKAINEVKDEVLKAMAVQDLSQRSGIKRGENNNGNRTRAKTGTETGTQRRT